MENTVEVPEFFSLTTLDYLEKAQRSFEFAKKLVGPDKPVTFTTPRGTMDVWKVVADVNRFQIFLTRDGKQPNYIIVDGPRALHVPGGEPIQDSLLAHVDAAIWKRDSK